MSPGRWRAVAIGATVGILLACFLPGPDLPEPPVPSPDKVLHLVAFLGAGLAWRLSGLGVRGVLALGVLLALVTELGQALLPTGRQGDVLDALADLVGLVLGLLVAGGIRARARAARAVPPNRSAGGGGF